MHPSSRRAFASLVALAVFITAACNREQPPADAPATTASPASAPATERVVGPLSDADAAALATMNDRIADYLRIHQKVESELPKLPTDATPQQIDQNQRAFEQQIRQARASAKQGDIFTPEATPVILRLLATVFEGAEGKQLKAAIMDENPSDMSTLKIGVNARYPDTVPLTTVPADVLQTLPKLTEDLEYRFVGDALILLDAHAHVIADYIPNAIPR